MNVCECCDAIILEEERRLWNKIVCKNCYNHTLDTLFDRVDPERIIYAPERYSVSQTLSNLNASIAVPYLVATGNVHKLFDGSQEIEYRETLFGRPVGETHSVRIGDLFYWQYVALGSVLKRDYNSVDRISRITDEHLDKYITTTLETLIMEMETFEELQNLPLEVEFTQHLTNKICYDISKKCLFLKGIMSKEEKNELIGLSKDKLYKKAIKVLFDKSQIKADEKFLKQNMTKETIISIRNTAKRLARAKGKQARVTSKRNFFVYWKTNR